MKLKNPFSTVDVFLASKFIYFSNIFIFFKKKKYIKKASNSKLKQLMNTRGRKTRREIAGCTDVQDFLGFDDADALGDEAID